MAASERPESQAGPLGGFEAEMIAILAQYGLDPELIKSMDYREVRRLLQAYAFSCFFKMPPLDFRWFIRPEYPGPNQCQSIANQCTQLAELFPGIDLTYVDKLPTPPDSVKDIDGWWVMPTDEYLRKRYRAGSEVTTWYLCAVALCIMIDPAKRTPLLNQLNGIKLTPPPRSVVSVPGDVMVVGVSAGYNYAGLPPEYVQQLTQLHRLRRDESEEHRWSMTTGTIWQGLMLRLTQPDLSRVEKDAKSHYLYCLSNQAHGNRGSTPSLVFDASGTRIESTDQALTTGAPRQGTLVLWLPPT